MASPTAPEELPVLTDEAIDRLEAEVFRGIRDERARDDARRRIRRRRTWMGVGAAAAVVTVAAVISPAVLSGLSGGSGASYDSAVAPDIGLVEEAPVELLPGEEDMSGGGVSGATESTTGDGSAAAREIIATAQASLRVDDVTAAADRITGIAEGYDGYVESLSVGTDGGGVVMDGMDASVIYPPAPAAGQGWISVRIPSEDLQTAIDDLDDVGEVTTVSISRADVTEQAIDLRARVDATRASVERLTELMQQTGSVGDLIEAEVALSDRQALLESYEQQLTQLEEQVAMSSLQVDLSTVTEPVEADPAGFGDGLLAGWNGLVATLNGIVIAFGFLIPWLVVIGVVGGLVWLVARAVRRRREAARGE